MVAPKNESRRSRKWLLATASFTVLTIFCAFALVRFATDATGAALIIASWVGGDATILGGYGIMNVAEKRGGGV